MHNIKDIRNNIEEFKNKIKDRNFDNNLDDLLEIDKENRILIQDDAVILDMILKLNGNVKKIIEKFKPEGGAYGMGRTHSHKH